MSLFKKLFKKEPVSVAEPPKVQDKDVETTVFGHLREKADPKCKKCHGRGYIGVDRNTKQLFGCPCLRKMVRKKEKLAQKEG